jgi:hypothetical protein
MSRRKGINNGERVAYNGEVRPVAESSVQAERTFLWDWRRGNNNDERICVECDLGLDRYLSDVYELMFVPVEKLCPFKVVPFQSRDDGSALEKEEGRGKRGRVLGEAGGRGCES